uniref:Uncharacterized protein n=1 Tax=Rhizophora mucronata TaxID=61149 RepID=A0A2P2P2S3_RHIMU
MNFIFNFFSMVLFYLYFYVSLPFSFLHGRLSIQFKVCFVN